MGGCAVPSRARAGVRRCRARSMGRGAAPALLVRAHCRGRALRRRLEGAYWWGLKPPPPPCLYEAAQHTRGALFRHSIKHNLAHLPQFTHGYQGHSIGASCRPIITPHTTPCNPPRSTCGSLFNCGIHACGPCAEGLAAIFR